LDLVWWGVPVVASLIVMAMIVDNHRAMFPMMEGGDPGLYHHPFASLIAAVKLLPQEFLAMDGEPIGRPGFVRGAVVKVLFFVGMHCCWVNRDRVTQPGQPLLPLLPLLTLSMLIGMLGMLGGSFDEFGVSCCDRHAFVRHSCSLIAIAAAAISIPPLIASTNRWRLIVAPAALVLAAGLLISGRVKDLTEDYRYYDEPALLRARTMASGASPGPSMTMYLPYSDALFPSQIPAGSYTAADNWWTPGILRYFHKESVQILIAPARGQR
jgi:hypothetical protein